MLEPIVRCFRNISDQFWDQTFWLPQGTTWADFENQPDYAQTHELAIPVKCALVALLGRVLLQRFVIQPVGRWVGLKDRIPRPKHHDILEAIYQASKPKKMPSTSMLSEQVGLSEQDILQWFLDRAKYDKPTRMDKFCESSWKSMVYVSLYAYGTCVLWDKPWFWNILECWHRYPQHSISIGIWAYYMAEMTYYWSLLISQFFDIKRSDFWEMFVHHIATILLLSLSWVCNFVRIGTLVMWVHDLSDVFLESAKMFRYAGRESIAHFCFYCFALSWMITRLGLLPSWILYSVVIECVQILPIFGAHQVFSALLSCLLVLHLFWAYYIFKVAYLAFFTPDGVIEKDLRSDTESGDDEDSGSL